MDSRKKYEEMKEDYIDKEATELCGQIERQLEIYVPDIELYEVNGDFDSNNHTLKITLVYSVIGSSDLDAIEINVDADETKYVSFDYKKSVGGY